MDLDGKEIVMYKTLMTNMQGVYDLDRLHKFIVVFDNLYSLKILQTTQYNSLMKEVNRRVFMNKEAGWGNYREADHPKT